jgi:hypothetical protein
MTKVIKVRDDISPHLAGLVDGSGGDGDQGLDIAAIVRAAASIK